MDWVEVAKLVVPSAVCAYFLGLRTSTACLIGMVTVLVFGLGLLTASNGGEVPLDDALAKVARTAPQLAAHMIGVGAAGILLGWWAHIWVHMVRASRMTGGTRSPI